MTHPLGGKATSLDHDPVVVALRPPRPVEPAPLLVQDAVDFYLGHFMISRFHAHTVRRLAAAVGQYSALVDVEDEDVSRLLEWLWRGEPASTRRLRRKMIADWLACCRRAGMPVPLVGHGPDVKRLLVARGRRRAVRG